MMNSTQTILMAALSTLSPLHLSRLTQSIASVSHNHCRRLTSLLSSPILFSLTLRHLQSLSLHQKSLLIARHLQSNLILLNHFIHNTTAPPPPNIKLRDIDAALLLLILCEFHQHDPEFLQVPPSIWRVVLCDYFSRSILRLSSFGGFCSTEILIKYIESVARCRNFVSLMGGGVKEMCESAAVVAVVKLPSVEVSGGECVICKEEMKEGRDVCELPCEHLFHWICILRWLKKRNTCPCCRYRLPTDDAHCEIERLMEDFGVIGGSNCGGGGRLYRECV